MLNAIIIFIFVFLVVFLVAVSFCCCLVEVENVVVVWLFGRTSVITSSEPKKKQVRLFLSSMIVLEVGEEEDGEGGRVVKNSVE